MDLEDALIFANYDKEADRKNYIKLGPKGSKILTGRGNRRNGS